MFYIVLYELEKVPLDPIVTLEQLNSTSFKMSCESIFFWRSRNIVISLKSKMPFSVYSCLVSKLSWTVHIHFIRLTASMTWVNDRWSDDHVGTVVIRCRSRAGRIPDHG